MNMVKIALGEAVDKDELMGRTIDNTERIRYGMQKKKGQKKRQAPKKSSSQTEENKISLR